MKDFSGNRKPGLQADPSGSPIPVKGRTKLVSGWLGQTCSFLVFSPHSPVGGVFQPTAPWLVSS